MLYLLSVYLIPIDELLISSLSKKLTSNEIYEAFKFKEKWKIFSITLIPFLILIKLSFLTIIIYIGVIFNIKEKISFQSIFNILLKGEFIFLLTNFFKILWFYLFKSNYSLEEFQYFYPFSSLSFFEYKEIEPWMIYPLQILNLFELVYIIILSYQIGTLTKTNADTGLKIVASSYIPALLLWVTVVMFFTLNFS